MTDIAELIERLRNNNWSGNVTDDITRWADSRSEAATALETLQAENERLSALAAINALPAVTVTDDMVERACETIGQMTVAHHTNGLLFKDVPEDDKPLVRKIVRAALEAALPNPPVSGEEM